MSILVKNVSSFSLLHKVVKIHFKLILNIHFKLVLALNLEKRDL